MSEIIFCSLLAIKSLSFLCKMSKFDSLKCKMNNYWLIWFVDEISPKNLKKIHTHSVLCPAVNLFTCDSTHVTVSYLWQHTYYCQILVTAYLQVSYVCDSIPTSVIYLWQHTFKCQIRLKAHLLVSDTCDSIPTSVIHLWQHINKCQIIVTCFTTWSFSEIGIHNPFCS